MLISIDWLQLHFEGNLTRTSKYQFKKRDYGTSVFEVVEDIYKDNVYLACICSSPRSSVLSDKMIIIKIINSVLYDKNLFTILDEFLTSIDCEYIGLTRLDVCADFNTFKNGLYPENLINKFMTNKVRKLGQTKGRCYFEQKERLIYDTLRFGTGSSRVSAYLYNKSKELREVKNKLYIIDAWKSSGLDVSSDVWRLEFAIKGNDLGLINKQTGEYLKPNLANLRDKSFLYALFYALQNKYFHFKIISKDKNVSRWKNVDLLPPYPTNFERIFITNSTDTGRADKIFLRKLDKVNSELRAYKQQDSSDIINLITSFAIEKGLADYYLKNINGIASKQIKMLKNSQAGIYKNERLKFKFKEKEKDLFDEQKQVEKLEEILLNQNIRKQ